MKGSSIAHPIQGLIKYHGLKDDVLRIPYHDSISVATSPTNTHTTLEFGNFRKDTATVDGKQLAARELERVVSVIDEVRNRSGVRKKFRMESRNNFPSNVGLGASASGFAALAVAACSAADMKLSLEQISVIARRGAGSATRSVTGAFSRWRAGFEDEESYSYQIASEDFQMGIVVALIPAFKQTEDAHKAVLTSPFFHSRLAFVHGALAEMENAIRKKNISKIGALAERDSLILHGITMTSVDEMLLWRPETVKVMLEVRKMRSESLEAYFSIDTGATVYVNTAPKNVKEVERRIKALGIETLTCGVGGAARITEEHLF
ncbi:MAG: diphosphomevalonate decarboxylase [Euryarchaeota archaeon RBG_19FT_COMBO_56_21]|nr:MAG: diphosphomevalonate decarboxylase [Euryarchaeota archaeon RBG_19FT_COMBO_56_21]